MNRAALLALIATPLLAAPAFADCTQDIKDALVRANTGGPYRMMTTITGATPMEMTLDMVPPTGMHSKSMMAGQEVEMIFTDGRGWMNMAGAWTELPPESASQMALAFDPKTIENMGTIGDPQCLGLTSVEGKDLLTFKYNFDASGMKSASTLYLDPATNLPTRMEATAEISGSTSDTVVTYEYDPSITISPPEL